MNDSGDIVRELCDAYDRNRNLAVSNAVMTACLLIKRGMDVDEVFRVANESEDALAELRRIKDDMEVAR